MISEQTKRMSEAEVRRVYDMVMTAIGYTRYPDPYPPEQSDPYRTLQPPGNLTWEEFFDILADVDDHPQDYESCENCGCPVSIDERSCRFCGKRFCDD